MSSVRHIRLIIGSRVPHLEARNIRDKSPTSFVSGNNDPGKTGRSERLAARGIRNHDLAAAKKRIELADAKYRLIAVCPGYNDDLVQDVIFNA